MLSKAKELITRFKGASYIHGVDVLHQVSDSVIKYGQRVLVIGNEKHLSALLQQIVSDLLAHQCHVEVRPGARINTPLADVKRIANEISMVNPEVIIVVGGGSTIDAVKAANVLANLGGDIHEYFGTGLVSEKLANDNKQLLPIVAVATVAGSAAHLTKYANVTHTGQKKLVIDEGLVPACAIFDYRTTISVPLSTTVDGALDGISHALEVFYGSTAEHFALVAQITKLVLSLTLQYLPKVMHDPHDLTAREALGLATDLGGYAIMVGGTNGAHLTSFSFVDILSHGRACGILNPYYTVFFGKAITSQLQEIGKVYHQYGYLEHNSLTQLSNKELALAVAQAMIKFNRSVGFPASLSEVVGFDQTYLEQALEAAQDPQLEMKLRNMPVPLRAAEIEEKMRPILTAAYTGDLSYL